MANGFEIRVKLCVGRLILKIGLKFIQLSGLIFSLGRAILFSPQNLHIICIWARATLGYSPVQPPLHSAPVYQAYVQFSLRKKKLLLLKIWDGVQVEEEALWHLWISGLHNVQCKLYGCAYIYCQNNCIDGEGSAKTKNEKSLVSLSVWKISILSNILVKPPCCGIVDTH